MALPFTERFTAFFTKEGRLGLIKNVSIVFTGSVFSRALNLLVFVLLARGLTVEQYGILTVLLSVTTTMADLVNSGLTASTMRQTALLNGKDQKARIGNLLSTVMINSFVITIVTAFIVFILAAPLSDVLFKADYKLLIIASACGLFTTFMYGHIYSTLHGLQDFTGMLIYSVGFGLERLLPISLLFFSGNLNIGTIVILFTVTPFIPLLFGFYRIKSKFGVPFTFPTYDRPLMKEMLGFGGWMTLWSVVAIVQSRMDVFLLASLTSTVQASFYDVAQKMSSILSMGVGAYANVINPKIATYTNKEKILQEMRKIIKVTVAMTFGLVVGAFIIPYFIIILFGEKYTESLMPLRIMIFGLVFFMWTFPFNSVLYAIGKSQGFFFTAILQLIANTISSLIFIPQFGASGAAISFCIVNIVAFICSYAFYRYFFVAKYVEKIDE
ncbi:MAG: oligosaccharide flippase family protein [Candidatus Dojkabacteria bacterium]|nr:MAG: oligosaccharide flippase family protein [Candidatus Dojkabacteria bacterium]